MLVSVAQWEHSGQPQLLVDPGKLYSCVRQTDPAKEQSVLLCAGHGADAVSLLGRYSLCHDPDMSYFKDTVHLHCLFKTMVDSLYQLTMDNSFSNCLGWLLT